MKFFFKLKLLLAFVFLAPLVSCEKEAVLEENPSQRQEIKEEIPISAKDYAWLRAQEGLGGHTINRHVNKSDAFLDARIATGLPNASTFVTGNITYSYLNNVDELGDLLENVYHNNRVRLDAMRPGDQNIVINVNAPGSIGYVRDRSMTNTRTFNFRTVWKAKRRGVGAFLLTAFPTR